MEEKTPQKKNEYAQKIDNTPAAIISLLKQRRKNRTYLFLNFQKKKRKSFLRVCMIMIIIIALSFRF